MALHITHSNNEFTLRGNLNSDHMAGVQRFFENKIMFTEYTVIDLRGIEQLSLSARRMFRGLRAFAFQQNNVLNIISSNELAFDDHLPSNRETNLFAA